MTQLHIDAALAQGRRNKLSHQIAALSRKLDGMPAPACQYDRVKRWRLKRKIAALENQLARDSFAVS